MYRFTDNTKEANSFLKRLKKAIDKIDLDKDKILIEMPTQHRDLLFQSNYKSIGYSDYLQVDGIRVMVRDDIKCTKLCEINIIEEVN